MFCWYTSSEGVFVFGFMLFCIVSWLVGLGFPVVVMCLDPCVQVSYCGHCPLLYFHACAFPSFFSLRSTYSLCHVVVLLPELTFFVFSSRHASCCTLLWVWAFIHDFGDRGIVSSRSCNFVTVGVGGFFGFFGFFGGFTVIDRLVLLPRTAGLPLEVTAYFFRLTA